VNHTVRRSLALLCVAACLPLAGRADTAAAPDHAQCVAPAKPGGGFDVTCQLARAMLADAGLLKQPLPIAYLPGGIGSVAYHTYVSQRPAEAGTLVAFSGGSLLNLAQGRFGPYGAKDVRWVAAIGLDHGVIVVRRDSPWRTLKDLTGALQQNLNGVIFGAGGTVGSQDWFKAALMAQAAGADPKAMRFVAFEGGGQALAALQGGHVGVVTGDAAEVARQIAEGVPLRVLAVLAPRRLASLPGVPTAREQGHDLHWPIVRGFYLGPHVGDAAVKSWTGLFNRAMAAPGFAAQRAEFGLEPLSLTGAELDAYVQHSMAQYRELALRFKLPLR
jgi:putative tricarboxylic transport membrane protein